MMARRGANLSAGEKHCLNLAAALRVQMNLPRRATNTIAATTDEVFQQ